jgi:hypothetical protein
MTTGENAEGPAPGPPPLRIGTAERESAAKALDAHLEAGRLGVEEYADRSAAAAGATVASELAALFTDLPAPHPVLPGTAMTPVAPAAATAPQPIVGSRVANRPFNGWGPRIVAVTPILALVLFLLFNGVFPQAWVFFLLIPVVGGVVYGGDQREERDERRSLRRGDD